MPSKCNSHCYLVEAVSSQSGNSTPSQNTNLNDIIVTGDPQAYQRDGWVHTYTCITNASIALTYQHLLWTPLRLHASDSSLIQDSTYNFQNEQSVTKYSHVPSKEASTNFYIPARSGNIQVASDLDTATGISGKPLPAVPAPFNLFNQQGLAGPSTSNIYPWQNSDQASLPLALGDYLMLWHDHGWNWLILHCRALSLRWLSNNWAEYFAICFKLAYGYVPLFHRVGNHPINGCYVLEQHHGLGVSASVTITGLPAFNIPMDVAIILLNMYRHWRRGECIGRLLSFVPRLFLSLSLSRLWYWYTI